MADNLNGKKHKYFGSLGLTGQLSEREKKWRLLVGIGLGTIALFTYLKTQLGYTKNVNTMMHDYMDGGAVPSVWILETGRWDDSGRWDDNEQWKDG